MSVEGIRGPEHVPFLQNAMLRAQQGALLLEQLDLSHPQIPGVERIKSGSFGSAAFDFREISYNGFDSRVAVTRTDHNDGTFVHEVLVTQKPNKQKKPNTIFTGGSVHLEYRIGPNGSIDTTLDFHGERGDLDLDRFEDFTSLERELLAQRASRVEMLIHDNRIAQTQIETLPEFHMVLTVPQKTFEINYWGFNATVFMEESNSLLSAGLNAAQAVLNTV